MPAPRSRRRARLAVLASVALALTGLQLFAAPAVQANLGGTGLVIREVYGAGGNASATFNADFVELYNPTGASVSLNGLGLQYRSATGGSGGVVALSGTLPAGEPFLVQMSAAGAVGAALPTPNFVASPAINMSGTAGQVLLLPDTTPFALGSGNVAGNAGVVDMIGFGSTATTFEGALVPGPANSTQSLSRDAVGTDHDTNNADFTLTSPPTPVAGNLPLAAIAGTRKVVVNTATSFNLGATGGTPPYSWTATGTPPGLTVAANGTVSGTPTTAGSYPMNVTVTDSATTPATDSKVFTIKVNPASGLTNTIAEIQGTQDESPFENQTVTTTGVVTARFPAPSGLSGFYIQTPGPDTTDASDAIFVFTTAGFTNPYPAIGDSVQVKGAVSEFNGLTELTLSSNANLTAVAALGTVTPKTQVPESACVVGACPTTAAALNASREASEGELFQPTAPWTATDVYDGAPLYNDGTNGTLNNGEIGLAADSNKPLVAPTEVIDAQATAQIAARIAWNNAHRIILDDGSSKNYTANTSDPAPWQTLTSVPRVGSAVTFPAPVVFTWGFNQWRIEPTTMVTGAPDPATQPQFSDTRTPNAAPAPVGGEVKLATFNVLNFFPTTGNEFVSSGLGTCTYFTDRQGNQITNNTCNPNGPRGAANAANLQRQRDKIVTAINTANADIVSLEELENSVQFGKDRDFAINELVTALNVGNPGKWGYAPSPPPAQLPALADQDVIRTGFIYQPATVALVGASRVLANQSSGSQTFANAREPLAQAFKKVGTSNGQAFAVVVNHFKSKGSGTPDPNGQGNANADRIAQANSLLTFANQFKLDRGITRVFLVGDFNAYSEEDPVQAIVAGGYTEEHSTTDPDEETYNFDGQIGSLDHVFANAAAHADVTGADVWPINGYESVYYEYSRFNYNVTNLYDTSPFRSSDHSPEIVGIHVNTAEPAARTIQILGTNDFHGRLQNDTTAPTAGAAVLAGAVKQLRQANPDTVFAAAGDLIGASTFESFIQKDKPTIDALNEAGLEVSSVGNHEFDQGSNDLVNRVMAPYDATTNPYGGASWQYIGANVRKNGSNDPLVPETWTKDFGSVKVGFVGAVTEHLPELVAPGGISGIHVDPIVSSVNTAANQLKAGGADLIVVLVHEGAASTDCVTMDDDPTSDFGKIIAGVDDNVDAIVSGHTHLAYNCHFPVTGWAGRPVTERPVVSAGQYGMALNKLTFTVATGSGQVQSQTQDLLLLKTGQTANYPADPATATIVSNAVAAAAPLGAVVLGKIGGPFKRGFVTTATSGSNENRGTESTLGNLVAEIQRSQGGTQIAFMNPGGLRTDLLGVGATGDPYPRDLTYKQAADVQPFANTLVNMRLTGAQIKTVLEQQWQPGNASRPFLKLGISKGLTYTSDDSKTAGNRITGIWLNGTPIVPATQYTVTVNSFLSTGGDNFTELANGTNKQDTGKTDLQAQVDYFAAQNGAAVPVGYKQNGVNLSFPVAAPASYAPGDHVLFNVSGWSMSQAEDAKDTAVTVKLGTTTLGTATLDNAPQPALPGFDVVGKAGVDVVVPNTQTPGPMTLTLVGATTGTESQVTVTVVKGSSSSVSADGFTLAYGEAAPIPITVTGAGAIPTGTVHLVDGATEITSGTLDAAGKVTLTVPGKTYHVGQVSLTAVYDGDATHNGSQKTITLTTTKATSITAGVDGSVVYGQAGTATVNVTAPNGVVPTGTVTVKNGGTVLGSAALASGSASVTIPAASLAVGVHTLTAAYDGDSDVQASTDDFTFTVTKAASTVTAPDVTVPVGSTGTQTVTVTAAGVTPTGTVTLKNGATQIGSAPLIGGQAQFNLPALPNGTVVTADYSGDANVAAGSTTFTVRTGEKATATLVVGNVTVEYGRTAPVTVQVTAPVAVTGTVTIKNGATTLGAGTVSGGVATITLPARSLPVGTATLSAEYSGDSNVNGAAKTFAVTVTKTTSTTDVTVKPKHPKAGHQLKLAVTVAGANGVVPTGEVTVKVDGKKFTVVLKNGEATVKVRLGKGSYVAKATYAGDSNVAGSKAKVEFTVT
jgi:predicted extracellular nuclease